MLLKLHVTLLNVDDSHILGAFGSSAVLPGAEHPSGAVLNVPCAVLVRHIPQVLLMLGRGLMGAREA